MRLPAFEIHVLQGKLMNSLSFQVTTLLLFLFSALFVTISNNSYFNTFSVC